MSEDGKFAELEVDVDVALHGRLSSTPEDNSARYTRPDSGVGTAILGARSTPICAFSMVILYV